MRLKIVLVMISLGILATIGRAQQSSNDNELVVTFTEALSSDDVNAFVVANGVDVADLRFETTLNGRRHVGGLTLRPEESFYVALERFRQWDIDVLNDMTIALDQDEAREPKVSVARNIRALRLDIDTLRDHALDGSFKIASVRVLDRSDSLARMVDRRRVRSVTAVEKRQRSRAARVQQQPQVAASAENLSPSTAARSSYPWAPWYGYSLTNHGSASNRFYWDDAAIAWFQRRTLEAWTYEHETQIYDLNYASINGYWISNLPDAYLDTGFLDEYLTPTVGTFNTKALKAGVQYYTTVGLTRTRNNIRLAPTATVLVKGQAGRIVPDLCKEVFGPQWCVNSWETTERGGLVRYTAPDYIWHPWGK